ncbi:hypothetical protein AgCh_012960 [Apium graveolens]
MHYVLLIDGFVSPSTSVAPMFPFYENSSEWDDFGEVINPDDYVIKKEDMEHASMAVDGDLDGKFDEGADSLILDMKPSKVVSSELTISLFSVILFFSTMTIADEKLIEIPAEHIETESKVANIADPNVKENKSESSDCLPKLNVISTLTGKFLELVDGLKKRHVDAICVQETKWKGAKTKEANGFKLWVMMIKLVVDVVVVNIVSAYAPHPGLGEEEKKLFWDCLDDLVSTIPNDQILYIGGDFNGHIGEHSDGYVGTHGGFGYGIRNEGGCTLLEFALAHELVIVNSYFKKRDAHLITFKSGGCSTQIDYFLTRRCNKNYKDCKVIPEEMYVTQHHLLVMDIFMRRKITVGIQETTPCILWKNLEGERVWIFKKRIGLEQRSFVWDDVNQIWNHLASLIRGVAKDMIGITSGKIHDQKEA